MKFLALPGACCSIVLDDEVAEVATVKRMPVPHYAFNEDRGSFGVDGIEYQEVDVRFKVRPNVNSAGFIRLSITSEVSTRIGELNMDREPGMASLPLDSTKSLSSEIILKDGFTMSLGGMGEEIEQLAVPPSAKSPGQPSSDNRREAFATSKFLMFVTAKTLNPDGTTYHDTADPRDLLEMGIVDADLPGYRIPDDALKALNQIRDWWNQAARDQAKAEYQSMLDDELAEH